MKFCLFLFLSCCWYQAAVASPKIFRTPVIPRENSNVEFFVPYTFGTHEGSAKLFTGTINLDFQNPADSNGEFNLPISAMSTKKTERDCHMVEALGLDYGESDFPEQHVCSENFDLPQSGKNAVKYPTIHLKIYSLKSLGAEKGISNTKESKVEVDGEWTIHGKAYRWLFPLTLVPEGENLRVKGEVPFSLKNHDIIVKPTTVLFMDVKVSDNIKVKFNVLLEPEL